tara:strand:- start:82 stop:402 length:321 start_codon:yes stop_codon:yes gene_type:complete
MIDQSETECKSGTKCIERKAAEKIHLSTNPRNLYPISIYDAKLSELRESALEEIMQLSAHHGQNEITPRGNVVQKDHPYLGFQLKNTLPGEFPTSPVSTHPIVTSE